MPAGVNTAIFGTLQSSFQFLDFYEFAPLGERSPLLVQLEERRGGQGAVLANAAVVGSMPGFMDRKLPLHIM
jgi:hypothetical protein